MKKGVIEIWSDQDGICEEKFLVYRNEWNAFDLLKW